MKQPYKWLDRRIAKPGPYLTLCLTENEMNHAARGMTRHPLRYPESGALCHTFTHKDDNELCAIVVLSQFSQTRNAVEIAGLLVHEAVHVWQAYAENMGEHHPATEQMAYGIQAISQELLAEYARRITP